MRRTSSSEATEAVGTEALSDWYIGGVLSLLRWRLTSRFVEKAALERPLQA